MSNPKSIRNSHTPTARELYFANIAATAATTERTLLVVWSDELRMNHQGNAWELEALQAARVAVRDALKIVASAPAAITPAATDSRPTHANATQVELASFSARTRGAIARYGIARCVSAYRLNVIDGEGARTIGVELDLTTQQANAACDAGRAIATARGLFHHAKQEESAPAAVDAPGSDAKPTKGAIPAGRGHVRVDPFSIRVRGKRVDIGADVIIRTRQHFQTLAQQCIDEVESGAVRVNARAKYVGAQRQAIEDSRAGKFDGSATFRQMAVYFATGESVGLLG